MVTIKFKPLHKHAPPPPTQATSGSAGMDVRADISTEKDLFGNPKKNIYIRPGERLLVKTGFAMEIPQGYEAQIRSRSGLALKNGVTVLNAPGTIDSDYRGEVCVILHNGGGDTFVINQGDRIAQMVIAKVEHVESLTVDSLTDTYRSEGGFGSTGTN